MNKIESIIEELNQLETQFDEKEEWTTDELSQWHTSAILLFESIGLRERVIEHFSVFFNSHLLVEGGNTSVFVYLDNSILKKKPSSIHLSTIKSTFCYAKKRVELLEEEEKIIPAFVMKFFRSKDKYGHIFTALSSIEESINRKNIETIVTATNTLLNSILDYDKDLIGKNLGKKLVLIQDNSKIASRLAIDKEVLMAWNNSRIIRNIELVHPKENIKQTIPFITAISYAYLVVLQLKIMMSIGFFTD